MLQFTVIVSFAFTTAGPQSWRIVPDLQKKGCVNIMLIAVFQTVHVCLVLHPTWNESTAECGAAVPTQG